MHQLRFLLTLVAVLTLSTVACFAYSARRSSPGVIGPPQTIPATGTIEVGFSPNGGITDMIVQEISRAKRSIEVQAYSFTSADIIRALSLAYKRGVNVRIILDKSQKTGRYSPVTYLANARIPFHIDRAFEIAHSKIMIVDQTDVITGSFNFTKAAEHSNAENCLIIRGNKKLVDLYEANWKWRWGATN